MMRTYRNALALLAVMVVTAAASAVPTSVFVVHCEPTKANAMMWLELVDLVRQADDYLIPLTIYVSPQWAGMILDDPDKITHVASWLTLGHEIGCHHHGYWGTKNRGSTWDGYTNTPRSQLSPEDRSDFLGTMDDYMTLLDALPGKRSSGCMGGASSDDAIDHPCQLVYSTQGHLLDDAAVIPKFLTRNGCDIWEIGHGLLIGQPVELLQARYLATADEWVFGVNGHVYDYQASPQRFIEWFRFLHSLDQDGTSRGTVSGILDLRM